MKPYIFGLAATLILVFSLAGIAFTAALALRQKSDTAGPLYALAIGLASLFVLIATLAWSLPTEGIHHG